MTLTLEHKIEIAKQVRDRKALLFGKLAPTLTKVCKTKAWTEIFKRLLALGAPIDSVKHLRKVHSYRNVLVLL